MSQTADCKTIWIIKLYLEPSDQFLVLLNMFIDQDRAVYTCDEGHQIIGVEKVVCQVRNRRGEGCIPGIE